MLSSHGIADHGVLGVDNALLLAMTCKVILEKSDLA